MYKRKADKRFIRNQLELINSRMYSKTINNDETKPFSLIRLDPVNFVATD